MIGAVLGDIIGSVFEGKNVKSTEIKLRNLDPELQMIVCLPSLLQMHY
jgi:hypothetical protein